MHMKADSGGDSTRKQNYLRCNELATNGECTGCRHEDVIQVDRQLPLDDGIEPECVRGTGLCVLLLLVRNEQLGGGYDGPPPLVRILACTK
jgi:hypothetical protein